MHNIRQYFVISLSVLIVAVIVLSISGTSNMFKLLSTLNACIATLFLLLIRIDHIVFIKL